MDQVPQTSAILALSKELITVRSGLNPQRDKCDSKMAEKIQGEIKQRNETKAKSVVRQKETQAPPWRPLWHNFPECSLIAGG